MQVGLHINHDRHLLMLTAQVTEYNSDKKFYSTHSAD
jgi:hypothetical protein